MNSLNILEEINCSQFLCKIDLICINSIYVCDGVSDCFSGEDEVNCTEIDYFYCSSDHQIAYQFVCDFNYDCSNKMDEMNCGKIACVSKIHQRLNILHLNYSHSSL